MTVVASFAAVAVPWCRRRWGAVHGGDAAAHLVVGRRCVVGTFTGVTERERWVGGGGGGGRGGRGGRRRRGGQIVWKSSTVDVAVAP